MGNRGWNAMKKLVGATVGFVLGLSHLSENANASERDEWRTSGTRTVYEPGMINENGQVTKPDSLYDGPGGITLQAGGGVTSFVSPESRDNAGLGGFWTVRTVLGLRSVVAVEAAYVGTSHALNSDAMNNGSYMLSNGLEAALRLNLPVVTGVTTIAPFLYGGIGWSHYAVVDKEMRMVDGRSSDNVLTWPVGAGLAFAYEHFVFDARVSWRFIEDNTLMRNADRDAMGLDSWSAGAQIGYLF